MRTNIKSSLSINRRSMLGSTFLALGTLLSGCHMKALGDNLKNKGKILLDEIPNLPKGLEVAVKFPLIEAIQGRRSRRFAMGAQIPDGEFKFKSKNNPLPLDDLEEMVLLTSCAGNTGWSNLIPYNKAYLPHIPNYAGAAGGRTFPSAAGFHTTDFFYTNDNGIFFFSTKDAPSHLELNQNGNFDLNSYLAKHKEKVVQLSDKRLHIPREAGHMEMHNTWCANVSGSTMIFPVSDLAQHHILNLCYIVQNGACIYDDINDKHIPGIEKFSDLVDLKNPYPLSYLEQLSLQEVTVESSTSCYAGALMLQAMGLGGWMYEGINPFSLLGATGDPNVPGLGFRYDANDKSPLPNVTGLPGIFEGHCPPHYKNIKSAVESVIERKYGKGGPFNAKTKGPYQNNARKRNAGKPVSDHFIECVTLMADYTFQLKNKFPATIPSIFTMMFLQAHHLDLEYYDRYFDKHAYLNTHAHHMDLWHPQV